MTNHGHPMFYELTQDEIELHSAKNKDYAQGGDPLGNFKRVAHILSAYQLDLSRPEVVAIVYMLKQLDAALWMLSQGYEGEVENVDTRLRDVHVYVKLARVLRSERLLNEESHIKQKEASVERSGFHTSECEADSNGHSGGCDSSCGYRRY